MLLIKGSISLLLLLFCWSIIPTLTGKPFESNSLLWFVFLYSLAGYLRKFDFKISLTGVKLLLISTTFVLLTFLSVVIFDILGTRIHFFASYAKFFYSMQKFPILIVSLTMFLGFSKLNIKYNKFINVVASASFGVYLIHDNNYVRDFLWNTLFKNDAYSKSNILVLYSMFVILVVFVGCVIIELLRIYLLEKIYMSAINKITKFIEKTKNSTMDRILEKS